jgi:hypothetical protein
MVKYKTYCPRCGQVSKGAYDKCQVCGFQYVELRETADWVARFSDLIKILLIFLFLGIAAYFIVNYQPPVGGNYIPTQQNETGEGKILEVLLGASFCNGERITVMVRSIGFEPVEQKDVLRVSIDEKQVNFTLTKTLNQFDTDLIVNNYDCGGICKRGGHHIKLETVDATSNNDVFCF